MMMTKRLKKVATLLPALVLCSCVCQVQTAEAIRLHGQECSGIILKGWGSGDAEFFHVGDKVYVKGIETRLERVDCELAYYQCPSFRKGYAPVHGALQRDVFVQLLNPEKLLLDTNPEYTLPAGAQPGPGRELAMGLLYYDYCRADAGKNVRPDPVVGLSPMAANDRAWYTAPLSVVAFTLVDVPGTILGSAGGALYILLSPFESFTMQYDDWGYNGDLKMER